jgi:hypothetical protein
MEEALMSLLALIPGEHTRAVLGWLYIISALLTVARWTLARYAPRAASNPWTQAVDTLAQLVTMSSKRLADHDHLRPKDPLETLIAEKGLEVVNRGKLP